MTTILLHPIGLDRTTWDVLERPDWHAIDLPGHGASDPAGASTLGEVADFVISLTAQSEPVDLVGLSLGGMIALHAGIRHPDRVRSLVVACAPAAAPAETMMRRADETEQYGMAATLSETLARWFSPSFLTARPDVLIRVEERLLADDAYTIGRYWRLIAGHDVRPQLPGLQLPVTVIAGSADSSVPPSTARGLAAGLSNARFVELEGAHMLHLESPHTFRRAVLAHLAWVTRTN